MGDPDSPDVPPDGGARAWLVVLGSSLALFSTTGAVNAYVPTLVFPPQPPANPLPLGLFSVLLHRRPSLRLLLHHHRLHRRPPNSPRICGWPHHRSSLRRLRSQRMSHLSMLSLSHPPTLPSSSSLSAPSSSFSPSCSSPSASQTNPGSFSSFRASFPE